MVSPCLRNVCFVAIYLFTVLLHNYQHDKFVIKRSTMMLYHRVEGVFWESALFFNSLCTYYAAVFCMKVVYVLFSFCGAVSDGGRVIVDVISCPVSGTTSSCYQIAVVPLLWFYLFRVLAGKLSSRISTIPCSPITNSALIGTNAVSLIQSIRQMHFLSYRLKDS
jgi:hypothetical protein